MTVVTKPLTDKKDEKEDYPIEHVSLDLSLSPSDRILVLPKPHKRTSGTTLLCLTVWALMVVCVGILSGFYVYQHYARPHVRHFQGWYNIPYEQALARERGEDGGEINQILSSLLSSDESIGRFYGNEMADDPMLSSMNFFKQKFEIGDDFEKIDVPDFKDGRPSRYIHDFNTNKTGIIDVFANRCFVMDLDRESVLPPASILDIIERMSSGYYNVDISTVKQSMHAQLPAVSDVAQFGQTIGAECRNKNTYTLVQNEGHLVKREAHAEAIFAEFAGKHIAQIDVLNFDDLRAYEEKNANFI